MKYFLCLSLHSLTTNTSIFSEGAQAFNFTFISVVSFQGYINSLNLPTSSFMTFPVFTAFIEKSPTDRSLFISLSLQKSIHFCHSRLFFSPSLFSICIAHNKFIHCVSATMTFLTDCSLSLSLHACVLLSFFLINFNSISLSKLGTYLCSLQFSRLCSVFCQHSMNHSYAVSNLTSSLTLISFLCHAAWVFWSAEIQIPECPKAQCLRRQLCQLSAFPHRARSSLRAISGKKGRLLLSVWDSRKGRNHLSCRATK